MQACSEQTREKNLSPVHRYTRDFLLPSLCPSYGCISKERMRTTNDHGGFKEIWQSRCINKYYSGDAVPRIAITAAAVPNYSVSFPGRLIRFLGPRRFHVVYANGPRVQARGGGGHLKEKKILKPVILGKSAFVWLPEPYTRVLHFFLLLLLLFIRVCARRMYEVFRCSFMALAAYIPREKLFVLIKFYCPHKSFWPI